MVDVVVIVVGTDGPPAPVLPGAIERAVQRENLEYSHTKAQFGLDYFRFMRNLAQANLPFISEERPDISVCTLCLSVGRVHSVYKCLFMCLSTCMFSKDYVAFISTLLCVCLCIGLFVHWSVCPFVTCIFYNLLHLFVTSNFVF